MPGERGGAKTAATVRQHKNRQLIGWYRIYRVVCRQPQEEEDEEEKNLRSLRMSPTYSKIIRRVGV